MDTRTIIARKSQSERDRGAFRFKKLYGISPSDAQLEIFLRWERANMIQHQYQKSLDRSFSQML